MIILDTNVISELMRPRPHDGIHAWLSSLDDTPLCITTVTIAEIEYGLHRLPEDKRRNDLGERIAQLIASMAIFSLEREAALYAGAFRAKREGMGLPTTPSDMMIAGIAAHKSANLATRNIRDFEHLPIALINPWRFE